MDLKDLTPKSDEIEVVLVHPNTGEPLMNGDSDEEMTITVYAPHTKEYRSALFEQAELQIARNQKGGKKSQQFLEQQDSGIELMARITKKWDITYDGVKPRLTFERALGVYKDCFWMKKQIETAIDDSLNFMKG